MIDCITFILPCLRPLRGVCSARRSDLLSVPQLQRQVSQYLTQCGSDRRVDAALVTAGHVGLDTHLKTHTHTKTNTLN